MLYEFKLYICMKGYLLYDEFRKVIKSIGSTLTDLQIEEVIRGVDGKR